MVGMNANMKNKETENSMKLFQAEEKALDNRPFGV